MEVDPAIRFSNGPASTVIVIEHPKQSVCPVCGTTLHLLIVGFQNVQMKTAAVPPSKRQLVIPVDQVRFG